MPGGCTLRRGFAPAECAAQVSIVTGDDPAFTGGIADVIVIVVIVVIILFTTVIIVFFRLGRLILFIIIVPVIAGPGSGNCGGLAGCQPLQVLGIVVLNLGRTQLSQQFFRLGFITKQIIVQPLCLRHQFCQQHIGFRSLGFHFRLGFRQFNLALLQTGLLLGQGFLGNGYFLCRITQLFNPAAVRCGDLFDHVQTVQQIRKAVCLEDHGPVRQAAVFFHGADTILIFFVQISQLNFRSSQFFLLVRNQNIVRINLLIDVLHFLVQQANLPVNIALFLDNIFRLRLVFGHFALQLLHLGLNLRLLFLQCVDLRLNFAGRLGCMGSHRQHTEHQTQQHGNRQNTSHNSHQ